MLSADWPKMIIPSLLCPVMKNFVALPKSPAFLRSNSHSALHVDFHIVLFRLFTFPIFTFENLFKLFSKNYQNVREKDKKYRSTGK